MPFWMLESDLFVQGVRQLANDPEVVGLGGFTVQGATQGLGYLDRLVSARLNWDINLDHYQLLRNELIARYGTRRGATHSECLASKRMEYGKLFFGLCWFLDRRWHIRQRICRTRNTVLDVDWATGC